MIKKVFRALLAKKSYEVNWPTYNINYTLYLKSHTDVQKAVKKRQFLDASHHFALCGKDEVKSGKRRVYQGFPIFDENDYLNTNSDVASALKNGFISSAYDHYLEHGLSEMLAGNRPFSGIFNTQLNDVFYKRAKKSFDHSAYVEASEDLSNSLSDEEAWQHFESIGAKEVLEGKRIFYPNCGYFDQSEYLSQYKDLIQPLTEGHFPSPFEHFINFGAFEIYKGLRQPGGATGQYLYRTPVLTESISSQIAEFTYTPLISVVMPVYNVDPVWLEKAYKSLSDQWYENWELCICDDASTREDTVETLKQLEIQDPRVKVFYSTENGNISVASNHALTLAKGDYIALMDNDDELTTDALFEVVKALQKKRYDFIYSDEDKIELNGRFVDPHFKPDFNPDMFMAHNYLSHLGVIEQSLVHKVNGWRKGFEGAQDYDLYLRVLELTQNIHHIPKVLYHWRKIPGSTASEFSEKGYAQDAGKMALTDAIKRRGINGEVVNGKTAGTYRVRYEIENSPLVSVIIPFRDQPQLLEMCLSSIFKHDSYKNIQIICMDNGSVDPEIENIKEKYADNERVEFYPYAHDFNYSAINNFAVNNYADGDYILLLNNDIEIVQEEWIQPLLELAQLDHAGAVGAMLLYPNDTVQHAGLILSPHTGHSIISAFKNHSAENYGYFSRQQCISNYAAVTAAMLMIKKSKYKEVNGFDENKLAIAYNDVDLCLKLLDQGYKNIYTPFCTAYHHESASRGFDDNFEKLNRQRKELHNMKEMHRSKFDTYDPCYSPNLTQFAENFAVAGIHSVRFDKYIPKPFTEKILCKERFSELTCNKICLFSHYDKHNLIDPYVLFYLEELSKKFDIIFVSTAKLDSKEIKKISKLVNIAIVKENYGYDFGSWKTAMDCLQEYNAEIEELLICNDSVYGPISDFSKLIRKFEQSPFDITSITDSFEINYHLQSYFVHFKKQVIDSKKFKEFWDEFQIIEDKNELILRNEIGLSKILVNEGFKLGAVAPASELGFVNNSHINWWRTLKDFGAGFIKIELLRDNPTKTDITNWEEKLSSISDYPSSLITKHLKRIRG